MPPYSPLGLLSPIPLYVPLNGPNADEFGDQRSQKSIHAFVEPNYSLVYTAEMI
jgi:hypothetical protein